MWEDGIADCMFNLCVLIVQMLVNYITVFLIYKANSRMGAPEEGLMKIFLFFMQAVALLFTSEDMSEDILNIASFFKSVPIMILKP